MEVFTVKNSKNVEKTEQKKKDIILKVRINNFDLDMQMIPGVRLRLYQEISGKEFGHQPYEIPIYYSTNLMGRS